MNKSYDSTPDTMEHIKNVRAKLMKVIADLIERGFWHDRSKMEEPEKSVYDKFTPLLSKLEYGTDAYRDTIRKMNIGVEHHYTQNRHHPEYFPDGINAMNLIDIIEMLVDWKAAGERHTVKPIDIFQSIEINTLRFKIEPQLKQILMNTAAYLWYE